MVNVDVHVSSHLKEELTWAMDKRFRVITIMALLFTGRYFHEFHEKVAFRENIIVNSYWRVA